MMTTKHSGIRVTSPPDQLRTQLPTGLTGDDAARISSAFTAAHTDSTRTVYGHAWRTWQRWCASRGIASLPGDPVALCAYLAERAEAGTAVATLNVACSAIGYMHRLHDLADPVTDPGVRRVRLGLRRTYGTGPRRRARALTVAEIRQIVTGIDQSKPIGVRDTAIILLGFASALRRSELTALTLADVEDQPGGLLLHLRHSKTDQEGHGQVVGVAHGTRPDTDPVASLDAWRALRGHASGPLFTRVWYSRSATNRLPATP